MKTLKFLWISCLVVLSVVLFNNVSAQTFSESSQVSPLQKKVIDLLKQEVIEDRAFAEDAESLSFLLNDVSAQDAISQDCFEYTPLLVNALDTNKVFISYYNIQGNFGYSFAEIEDGKPVVISFNFYEGAVADNGNSFTLVPSVKIRKHNFQRELENAEAKNYIVNNYCKPLNDLLSKNAHLQNSQLLPILKQSFSL